MGGSPPAFCGVRQQQQLVFPPCFGWIYLLSRPGQSGQLPLRPSDPGQQKCCSWSASCGPGAVRMLCCSWGRGWVAPGCRAVGRAAPEGRSVLGAMRGVKLSAAAAAASTFPSSLVDGRAGCWSSRALALSIHRWVVLPVKTSFPSPDLCRVCTRNDLGPVSWKAAKLSSERPWASSFRSSCVSLSLLSPIIVSWIPMELLYMSFHGGQE